MENTDGGAAAGGGRRVGGGQMCGIAGILQFDGDVADRRILQNMVDTLAHRGPDGQGIHVDGPVGLGHRRLAVLDLSPAGEQPMCNEDGSIWLTYNGEVYNHAEIRRDLQQRGHQFRSRSDTEIIVHAYEEWGVQCLDRLNGMFAFGLWDGNNRRLWLVRDRIGIKPLFYAHRPKSLLFASEIKGLLCDPTLTRTIDYQALAYYLALNWMPGPYSLLAEVRQVLPGHYLLVNADGRVRDVQYWRLRFREDVHKGEKAWVEQFDALMEDATRLRLVSDVPFGAFLSGGLDSSSVSYWMTKTLSHRLKTFSVGFDEASYDETPYARQVAAALASEHHERTVTPEAVEILPKLVWHGEEPTADASMVPFYYLARETRRHVTVALGGDGADELLAGYETYQAHAAARLYRLLPGILRRRVVAPLMRALPVSHAKISLDHKLRRFVAGADLSAEDAHAMWRIIFDAQARRSLLAPVWDQPGVRSDVIDLYRSHFAQTNARHPLNRLLAVDTCLYLPNDMLVKVDRMTMAHGLEARVPFLDHRVVEFCATVPPSLKLKGYRTKKYLLKAAMRRRLPRAIVRRPKQGFNSPVPGWIVGDLKPFVLDTLSARAVREMGIMEPGVVEGILSDHFQRRADNSYQIWCMLTLSLWYKSFIRARHTE